MSVEKASKTITKKWAPALEPLIGQLQQAELRQPLLELLAAVNQANTAPADGS